MNFNKLLSISNTQHKGLNHLYTQFRSLIVTPILQNEKWRKQHPHSLNQKWRRENDCPLNPNAYGPLTDLPDYSFLDGRPTPLGARQKLRLTKQREIAQKIMKLSSEIDFAVQRHKEMKANEENMKQQIIANKLKPKGHLLLKETK